MFNQYGQVNNYDSLNAKFINSNQTGMNINNRYQDVDDSIYIDQSLNDLRKNLLIQRENVQNSNTGILSKRAPLQPTATAQNTQKQIPVFQRNYIIYQPQTAFLQPEAPSERGSNLLSYPDDENNQQVSQRSQGDSFINDTECKDFKKSKLQQFVKQSDIWKEDSTALSNILNEKRDELRSFYIKQEEKVQHFFYILEKVQNQEKNNMIFALQESLKMNLNQIDGMVKQLQLYQEECDKLKEDVALNFTDIIEEMRNEPFNEILKMYTQKMQEFDQYTKKSCQSVHIEIVSLDFIGSSTTTNIANKWETAFKNNYMNKVTQLNSQFINLMKDSILKPMTKTSSREKVSFLQTQPHLTSQGSVNQAMNNQSNLNLSNGFHQSNSSLSINSKRSNRSASLVSGGNHYLNNNYNGHIANKSSLSNVQQLLQNNTLDFITTNGNTISQRSNEINGRNPSQQQRSQKNNSILNTSDQLSNNSFVQLNNSSLNLSKTSTLAQKIKTQTIKNVQAQQYQPPAKKKTNSVYTNVLKNMSKNVNGLHVETSKSINSSNKIMFTTTNATKKYIDLEKNNIENINTINFNFK